METLQFYTHTLPCEIRIVCAPSATEVVYCGLAIDSGTRDELECESGMAHLTEHMSFKGTSRRKAWHIINRMEAVGGDLNAFTGKEETVYYCTCLKPHIHRAIDILVDIVFRSTYPLRELEKEVEVVVSEIESYNDSPSELIYDEFENLLFANHSLGRNILGDADKLHQFSSEHISQYVQRMYLPSNMVFFVYGKVKPQNVVRMIEKSIQDIAFPTTSFTYKRTPLPAYNPVCIEKQMDTHQAHVMMGSRSFGGNDQEHLSMFVLNYLLGGPSMNSRLCHSLREKNGLVYTVESTLTTYTDTGVWAIYFGCEKNKIERCKQLIVKELKKLSSEPLSSAALSAIKKQIKGQIGVSHDNFENVAIGMGKRFLHYNKTLSIEEFNQSIDNLSSEELLATARKMFVPENLTLLTYK